MRVLQVFVSGISLLPLLLVCSQHWSSAAASTAVQLALFAAGACPRSVCFRDVSSALTCWHVSWTCLLPSVVVVVILVVLVVVVVVVVVVAAFCVVVVAKVLKEM